MQILLKNNQYLLSELYKSSRDTLGQKQIFKILHHVTLEL